MKGKQNVWALSLVVFVYYLRSPTLSFLGASSLNILVRHYCYKYVWCSWVFGLDFIGYYLLSLIFMFKVQFSSAFFLQSHSKFNSARVHLVWALLGALSSIFDHHIQSSVFSSVQFSMFGKFSMGGAVIGCWALRVLSRSFRLLSSFTFLGASVHFGSTFQLW